MPPGLHEMRVCDSHPDDAVGHTPGFHQLSINGQLMPKMCICEVDLIIEMFTKRGIRGRNMPTLSTSFVSALKHQLATSRPGSHGSLHRDRIEEVADKWNKYTETVPSLTDQCVWKVRSSLQIVSA